MCECACTYIAILAHSELDALVDLRVLRDGVFNVLQKQKKKGTASKQSHHMSRCITSSYVHLRHVCCGRGRCLVDCFSDGVCNVDLTNVYSFVFLLRRGRQILLSKHTHKQLVPPLLSLQPLHINTAYYYITAPCNRRWSWR